MMRILQLLLVVLVAACFNVAVAAGEQNIRRELRFLDTLVPSHLLLDDPSEFLERLCDWLRQELRVDVIYVGHLCEYTRSRATVVAQSSSHPRFAVDSYRLCDAPCDKVVRGQLPVLVAEQAQSLYPADAYFEEHGIQSYCGIPLFFGGQVMGLLVACHSSPRDFNGLAELVQQLESRLVGEIRRSVNNMLALDLQQTIRYLDSFLVAQDEALRMVAEQLSFYSSAYSVLIMQWLPQHRNQVRVLACVEEGAYRAELTGQELTIDDMPCALIHSEQPVVQVADTTERYPGFASWANREISAYRGYGLLDEEDGSVLGHVAVLHDSTMSGWQLTTQHWQNLCSVARSMCKSLRLGVESRVQRARMLREQKNESVGLMANTVAHDINNLLTVILGRLDLALLPGKEMEAVLGSIEQVQKSALDAAELASRLLNFSRDVPIGAGMVNAVQPVRDSIEFVQFLHRRSVDVTLACELDTVSVSVPASLLTQLMMNLLINALDAVTDQPQPEIRITLNTADLQVEDVSRMKIGQRVHPGEYARIAVNDNGAGIFSDNPLEIFEPFYTTKDTGTGLGLSAVADIVTKAGGAIDLYSSSGHGTEMVIYLPVVAAESVPLPIAGQLQAGLFEGKRVLVVDDDAEICETVRSLLELRGIDGMVATNAQQGLRLLNAQPFDALILDVSMPGMDGWSMLAAVRNKDADMPVLMISGYDEANKSEAEIQHLGAVFLKKPFRLQALINGLDRAARQSSDMESKRAQGSRGS